MEIPIEPAVAESRPYTSQDPSGDENAKDDAKWSLATRVAFRFMSVFLFLIIFPFPFESDDSPDVLPFLWHRVVPWVTSHVFHLSRQLAQADDTYFYFQLLTYALISALVTLLWSAIDRKRPGYPRVHDWMQLYVRIYLAAAVFSYGSAKLFPEQIRAPSLARLLQPFGDFSLNALM